jgi:Flp pilus assembly protein TadB
VHDPDSPQEPQQPDPSKGDRLPVESEIAKFNAAMDKDLGTFVGPEQEADLSKLDDAGLETEAKRETMRDTRETRQIRRGQAEQKKTKGKVDIGEQVTLLGLLVLAGLAAVAVVIVGLVDHNADIVRAGLVALCAICGVALYRLQSKRRKDKGK